MVKGKMKEHKPENGNSQNRNEVWEEIRALGLCLTCVELYPGHQCKVKMNIVIGDSEEKEDERYVP